MESVQRAKKRRGREMLCSGNTAREATADYRAEPQTQDQTLDEWPTAVPDQHRIRAIEVGSMSQPDAPRFTSSPPASPAAGLL
jgi:hypothetical protein